MCVQGCPAGFFCAASVRAMRRYAASIAFASYLTRRTDASEKVLGLNFSGNHIRNAADISTYFPPAWPRARLRAKAKG